MNNTYYPGGPLYSVSPNQSEVPPISIPYEQSYIENILRLNKGKKVTVYASYADSREWKDRIFKGIVEESGRDHIILSDPITGKWFLIFMIYVDYIEFDEKINYSKDFVPNNWKKKINLIYLS